MTQIDFYVLPDDQQRTRLEFVCRLTDKLLKLGKRVYIALDSQQQVDNMDAMLWTFLPDSFLPHHCSSGTSTGENTGENTAETHADVSATPIVLSHWQDPPPANAVYINLRPSPPADCGPIDRLVEVVIQDPAVLTNTRQHFKFYREQGYPIQSHTLS